MILIGLDAKTTQLMSHLLEVYDMTSEDLVSYALKLNRHNIMGFQSTGDCKANMVLKITKEAERALHEYCCVNDCGINDAVHEAIYSLSFQNFKEKADLLDIIISETRDRHHIDYLEQYVREHENHLL